MKLDCGRISVPSKPLIGNGAIAKYGTAPWNVGLYKLENVTYDIICGGSLISANLVVTGKNCAIYLNTIVNFLVTLRSKYKIKTYILRFF